MKRHNAASTRRRLSRQCGHGECGILQGKQTASKRVARMRRTRSNISTLQWVYRTWSHRTRRICLLSRRFRHLLAFVSPLFHQIPHYGCRRSILQRHFQHTCWPRLPQTRGQNGQGRLHRFICEIHHHDFGAR
ncbi:hypothetical protein PsorP6_001442 [Peronosclerospora sorghi]|uniref:Uncharacterized protein n=1 Tax=Peronosclerospora sorghi TaxID=230839 RepID=A0ACC0WR79_9STRA|nr:hypothetical protein PsorP6_001442 [Peronosclerospora sorghi]